MMRDEIEREVLGSTRSLTRMEFHQILDLGVFQDERVELMYGQIVKMMPTGTTHRHQGRPARQGPHPRAW